MSLIRQVVALLATVLVLALAGSLLITLPSARSTLETELKVKNADNAHLLALALSQHRGDATAVELLMAAQFAGGHYRRMTLVGADGQVKVQHSAPPHPSSAPVWFVQLVPLEVDTGVAQVSDGWRSLGRLELDSHIAYAHDDLWVGASRTAGWLALVGLLAAVVAMLGVRAMRRPLDATVEQATALQQGRFVTVPVPNTPELRTVSESMNMLVQRLRETFDAQVAQVAALRQLAEHDGLTGLPNRRHFVARMQASLSRGASGGLVLLRVAGLDGLNRRHGRARADALLGEVARCVARAAPEASGAVAGRLNGADFALYLPEPGVADTAARALVAALRQALPAQAADAVLHAGSAELQRQSQAGAAMALVDAALADAEAAGPFEHVHRGSDDTHAYTEDEWRRLIDAALEQPDGLALQEFPVVDAQGTVMHLECPLRLKVEGRDTPAARWLPHALRSRRLPALDLRGLQMALAAAQQDGRHRSINMALESLTTAGFVANVQHLLERAGPAAQRVLLELPERALLAQPAMLRDAARQWRAAGAQVGIEHAGGASEALAGLFDAGLSFAKIDRRHLADVATDPQVRTFARGLVLMLHGMRLKVVAEGVTEPDDLAALWALGFDAATGPAVRA